MVRAVADVEILRPTNAANANRRLFYEVLNRYQQVTTVLGTAYRVVRLGKSHQNIVVARLQTAAYLLAEELRSALEEVV